MAVGLSAKRLELLKEVAPRASRVLVLVYIVDPIAKSQLEELKKSAPSLGVQLHVQGIRTAEDLVGAFATGAKWRRSTWWTACTGRGDAGAPARGPETRPAKLLGPRV